MQVMSSDGKLLGWVDVPEHTRGAVRFMLGPLSARLVRLNSGAPSVETVSLTVEAFRDPRSGYDQFVLNADDITLEQLRRIRSFRER